MNKLLRLLSPDRHLTFPWPKPNPFLREALKKDPKSCLFHFLRLDHIWATFEKKYFFPLGGKKHLEKLQSWGYPPKKVTKKSVSKMTQNGQKWILNRSSKSWKNKKFYPTPPPKVEILKTFLVFFFKCFPYWNCNRPAYWRKSSLWETDRRTQDGRSKGQYLQTWAPVGVTKYLQKLLEWIDNRQKSLDC